MSNILTEYKKQTINNTRTKHYKMLMTVLNIQQVNNIISEHFIKIFGNVVEHYPAAAIGILKSRPFENATDISRAINGILDGLSINEKRNVLSQYPDVVAKLADLSTLMFNIEQYQKISGVDQLTIDDKQKLNELNRRYKEKFGFSFIKYGKQNSVFDLFNDIETRIVNSVDEEIELAIEEVKKIAKLRIHEILQF